MFDENLKSLNEFFPAVAEKLGGQKLGEKFEIKESNDGNVLFYDGQCLDHLTKPVAAAKVWVERSLKEERFNNCNEVCVCDLASGYHVETLLQSTDKAISVVVPTSEFLIAAMQTRDLRTIFSKIKNLYVGEATEFSDSSELLLRPQIQGLMSEFCSKLQTKFYGIRGLASLHPKFGVLGPIRGGTGPIMTYVARNLLLLGQRVRTIDMSGFDGGYQAITNMFSNELLQNSAQGQYVELLSKIILQNVIEKPIDILICMALAPITPDTLKELRKMGIITVLWFVEDYMRFPTWKYLASGFDYIFTIQKGDCIDAIKKAGCPEVHYLPTAFDPFVHCPQKVSEEDALRFGSPISFVGAGYHNRQQMFASLANLPFKIWGTEWPECKPFDEMVQENGRRIAPEEYVKIFNSTKINLNLHSSTERDGVDPYGDFLNPRTFELAGSGAFQLVDERTLLPEAFTPGKDIVTFKDTDDLKAKIAYYLEHEDERKAMAEHTRQVALQKHTYAHRLKEMLSIIYSKQYTKLKARYDNSTWHKVLERAQKYPELYKLCEEAFKRGEEAGLDGLVSDIVTGQGTLTETEQKLLFLFHISKQIIRMKRSERGE